MSAWIWATNLDGLPSLPSLDIATLLTLLGGLLGLSTQRSFDKHRLRTSHERMSIQREEPQG